jgi:putative hemolysin
MAESQADVKAAQRLRFQVFNVEMGEGLASAYETGLDADHFDHVCDHLLVEEIATGTLAGTYRLQTGAAALVGSGFYSAQEFDFTPFMSRSHEIVELGRACVHRQHRNLVVLGLLWKGIAGYARERGGRYLIGCSSLTSQDPSEGVTLYHQLAQRNLAPAEWLTRPQPSYRCEGEILSTPVRAPKLMSAYFSIGAKICGEPALDAEFQTIDFLTLLDLQALPESVASRYQLR